MASLRSFSFPLMKLLLYSSLSLALLSCFIEKSHALQGRKTKTDGQFLTLQISSLLPAAACSPSAGSINGQSTLEVFHRHGPCSKLSPDKAAATTTTTTTTPPLSKVLSDDQGRVKYIRARLNPDPTKTEIRANGPHKREFIDKNANLPVRSGLSLGSGNYLVTVGLGTPTKTLSLVFDTGSDLTWTQCQPCAVTCHRQQDPIFDPSSSTSYSNISCASSQCSLLLSGTGNQPGCTTGTCLYLIQYGDQSFSMGFFGQDKLSITATDGLPNFLFGCGQDNQGLFGGTAGIIGLGRDPISLVSQTAQKYGRYFSYCLPSISSLTGHLSLGKSGASNGAKFTPFDSSQGTSFYFISIVSISVGGKQLPISPSVFQTAGTIIDSGTVITRLPPLAYCELSTAFRQRMLYPSAPAVSILDTCFDFGNNTSIRIPTVSFTFSGNVKVDLDGSGILVGVSATQACLAFAANGDDADVGIFGNTQQKTFEVVYDVAGGKLGFGAGGCK